MRALNRPSDNQQAISALRVGGLGLLACLVFSFTYAAFWVYIHPNRDFWDFPIISNTNRVDDTVRAVMTLALAPIGASAVGTLAILLGTQNRRRLLISSIVSPPLAALVAYAFDAPALLVLIPPLAVTWLATKKSDDPSPPLRYLALATAVVAVLPLAVLGASNGLKAIVYGLLLWVLLPALAALSSGASDRPDRTSLSLSNLVLAASYGAVVWTAVVGIIALTWYYDPPKLTLFAKTDAAKVAMQGPVRHIDGPDDTTIDDGEHTTSYEVIGEGPVMVYYAREREGSGTSILGGDDPSDHAAWVVVEPPGAILSVWYEPGLSVSRVRLQIDRDADGTTDERRKPDTKSRWSGFDWRGPETRARTTFCGVACERIVLTTDGVASYYVAYPDEFEPTEYRDAIEFTEPSVVWFWSIGADGKVGPVGRVRALAEQFEDIEVEIEVDSGPRTLEIAHPGQEIRMSTITAPGQKIALRISDIHSTKPYEFAANVRWGSRPDGDSNHGYLLQATGRDSSITLMDNERYYITIEPFRLATGSFSVDIYTPVQN